MNGPDRYDLLSSSSIFGGLHAFVSANFGNGDYPCRLHARGMRRRRWRRYDAEHSNADEHPRRAASGQPNSSSIAERLVDSDCEPNANPDVEPAVHPNPRGHSDSGDHSGPDARKHSYAVGLGNAQSHTWRYDRLRPSKRRRHDVPGQHR
jgi:hypothetical protein